MVGTHESPKSESAPIVNPPILIGKEKRCSKCGEVKEVEAFRKTNAYTDGVMCWCRVCEAAYYVAYRIKNAERKREYRSKFREENKEDINKRVKERYLKNPDKYRERSNNFRKEHPEKVREYNRTHYLDNSEKIKEQSRAYAKANVEKRRPAADRWRAANGDKVKASSEKTTLKFKDDPKHKLNRNMSRGMHHTLQEGKKAGRHWETLVPYTIDQLKKHIEKLFKPGMTWENYGLFWHLDHIIPKSIFNYSSPEHIDFKRCWALNNLQPLEAKENLKKHAKIKAHFQPSLKLWA